MTVILTVAVLTSLFGFALDYLFVSAVKSELKKFSPDQRGTVVFADKTLFWAKRGAILGPILSLLPLAWVVMTFDHVPNTITGAIILFGPALFLLLSGAALFLFSQLVRLWARDK